MVRVAIPAALALAALAASPASGVAGPFSHVFGKPAQNQKAAASDKAALVAQQVQEALDERRFVDAADILERAGIDGIRSPHLITLSGEMFLARDEFPASLAQFRQVVNDPAERPKALEGEGLALSMTGKSDEAFADLKQATELDKTSWRAWNGLAREYDIRHDWKLSKAAYAQAMAAPGANTAIVLNNRGYSHLLQNESDLAIPDLVSALAKDPDLKAARTNLRIAMAIQGNFDRASMTGAGDDRAAVLNNVGLAAAIRGNYREAEKLLTAAIEAKGDNYDRAAANLELAKNLEARAQDNIASPNDTR